MQSLKSSFSKRNYGHTTREVIFQGSSQNLKQVPEHFIEAFNVDAITLTYQLLTSYRMINIASENINQRVTYPSNHCCQISLTVRERPGISVIIPFFLFLRCHNKEFKLLKPVHRYACMLTSPYQFDKKLKKHFPANIYLFKIRIIILRLGVKGVQT